MKYEGEWKDGREHGKGTFFFYRSKEQWVGEWKNGRKWNIKIFDKNGNFEKVNYINGVKQE